MRNKKLELALVLLVLSAGLAHGVTFETIGPGQGFQDISANGATALLFDFGPAFAYLWTAETGLTHIGTSDQNSPIYEISYDATTVVGTMPLGGFKQAALWNEDDGWQGLGGFPVDGCSLDNSLSSGWGVSADGSAAVGLGWLLTNGTCRARAFRWSAATGMVPLQVSNTHRQSRASAVSGDGRIAVGWTETDFGTWRPTIWQPDGTEQLLDPDPVEFSSATQVNYDGSVVVGEHEKHAFRWTAATGIVDLGLVPGVPGTLSRAVGVSADGSTIVGWGGTPPVALEAFVWTEGAGMQNLHDLIVGAGFDLGNKIVSHATAVSADGSTIVGGLLDPSTFTYQAYRVILGPPELPGIPTDSASLEGAPLLLDKPSPGDVGLSWSPTCLWTETDYGVYRGNLGSFSSHSLEICSTGGATATTLPTVSGSSYFLVVPSNRGYEGSYGTDSEGSERPSGSFACAPQQSISTCP